jgi:hypothetical protein
VLARLIIAGAAGLALVVPSAAMAQDYPAPTAPKGSTAKPKGPSKTLRVCKQKRCRFHTIQKAVNAAKAGDTIRVGRGTYREGVMVTGNKKRYIKIIGNASKPQRVLLNGTKLKGARAQNGININGANQVTVRGIKATGYKANGFFVTNADGYTFDRLIAVKTGVYGLYAFNTTGGRMEDSLSYYQTDGAYYIGQTPEQVKPKRSIVKNVTGWGSVIGFSGTNMRYVTIQDSKFFNNAVGIAPNALDSEKFPPEEHNVIRDSDIFWNNFDAYRAAPFNEPNAAADFVYPPGLGVILLSGRDNRLEGNRIHGNWLSGFAAVQNAFLKAPGAMDLENNVVADNVFGAGGADLNGRDLTYTGNGKGNCFSGNQGVQTTLPADPAAFPGCPGPDNQDNSEALQAAVTWGVAKKYRENWIVHQHPELDGILPLEDYKPGVKYGPTGL